MRVKLISYSQPHIIPNTSTENDNLSVQELIAYVARVSNPSNQSKKKTGEKLLKYLIKYTHWSPFEMVSACLEVETTRDIARQILRHRSFSFQEFSQRYANPLDELEYEIDYECRLQDEKNRQNSIELETVMDSDERVDLTMEWLTKQAEVANLCQKNYKWAIEKGIAKEVARKLLPEGMTKTRLYVNGTIRSWIHFIELRSANGTQKECMEVAKGCAEAISKIFPMITEFTNE